MALLGVPCKWHESIAASNTKYGQSCVSINREHFTYIYIVTLLCTPNSLFIALYLRGRQECHFLTPFCGCFKPEQMTRICPEIKLRTQSKALARCQLNLDSCPPLIDKSKSSDPRCRELYTDSNKIRDAYNFTCHAIYELTLRDLRPKSKLTTGDISWRSELSSGTIILIPQGLNNWTWFECFKPNAFLN